MGRKKEYLLLLDTETAGSLDNPQVYDLGYIITDLQGKVYEEKSYTIKEVFNNWGLMSTAYYNDKIPQYVADIKSHKRKLVSFTDARDSLINSLRQYDIKRVFAYNVGFDKKALNATIKTLSNGISKWFFPRGIEFCDIWHLACQVICDNQKYYDYCVENGFKNQKGNVKTSAEVVYRYISHFTDFVEKHTGIEDVKIEHEILKHSWKKDKKAKLNINPMCWKIPQKWGKTAQ